MIRALLLFTGLAVLAVAWLGPMPQLARQMFSAHMVLHVSIVAVAAPALAVGVAGGRFDPARWWPALFGIPMLPLLASVVEFLIVWAWHAPALHHAAGNSLAMLVIEQASYLVVGLLVWLTAFGGGYPQRKKSAPAGIAGLMLTSMHMALLGVLLALAGRTLYDHGDPVAWGLTPLQDQQLGGVIMLVFGGSIYLIGGLYLLAGLLKSSRRKSASSCTLRGERTYPRPKADSLT